MATIKDVAKMAGVSIGTVSAVLNGHTTIKAENIKKVNDAVAALDYQPNLAAKTLKIGQSKSIGLMIPDITNPYYPELARGVEDAARQKGLTVFLCNNDRNPDKERDYLNVLTSKCVDGIILVKPLITREELERLGQSCAVVLCDPPSELARGFDTVGAADSDGVLRAMELLFEYGHRDIAYISGQLESCSAINRFAAYKQALVERGIPFRKEFVRHKRYDWFSGYAATTELLKQLEMPTAIFAANDVIAMGALKALRERNLRVPEDVSVVGYDDIDQASYCTPALTTIRQPKYEMGVKSVELLARSFENRAGGSADEVMSATFETELIIRETVNYAKSAISGMKMEIYNRSEGKDE